LVEHEAATGAVKDRERSSAGMRSFNLFRFLSWISLVLILATSLFLSIFIANEARDTLLSKQRQFSLLLAENLNHQIFQRFTVPTLLRFGHITLQDEEQYEQLDSVVRNTIHGHHVIDLRIYDVEEVVSYSIDPEVVGREDLAGQAVQSALSNLNNNFEIVSKVSPIWSMFAFDLEPRSVVMRTIYPLRTERSFMPGTSEGQLMGILSVTQDITDDYSSVINFQWLIIVTSFVSSLFLFLILLVFIRIAGRLNLQRIQERERLESELHQAEKLASIGRMVSGIAHEIRNPLGIIRSSAEILLKRAREQKEEGSARILEAMYDEIKRLGQTVHDFLDYARPKQPRMDPVDLKQVFEQALTFLKPELERSEVTVNTELKGRLQIRGDKDLLYRALYNVLSNAVQAMEGGGKIEVTGASRDGRVRLSVLDTGPGFDEASLNKMTDPFFTTKDQGTGLGLAIVNNIVASHGGRLDLSNREDGGARVDIVFPKS
jgi:signal transduction histidine kinase